MDFLELLAEKCPELTPEKCKIHFAIPNKGNVVFRSGNPLEIFFVEGLDSFRKWQERQSVKNFELPYIISLIQFPEPDKDKWLFVGCFRKIKDGMENPEKREDKYFYRTVEMSEFLELSGRLVVLYEKKTPEGNSIRNSYLCAENLKGKMDYELKEREMTFGECLGWDSQNNEKIFTLKGSNAIFLFSENEQIHGDRWDEANKDVFLFAVREKESDFLIKRLQKGHEELLLFIKDQRDGEEHFVGKVVYIGSHRDIPKDAESNDSRMLVLELLLVSRNLNDNPSDFFPEQLIKKNLSEGDLFQKAKESASSMVSIRERRAFYYQRDKDVRRYVLERAKGMCEGCGDPAPFFNRNGEPYLEVHHVQRLSDGGLDDPEVVVALCPNCHREIHYGKNGDEINKIISEALKEKMAPLKKKYGSFSS